MRKKRKNNIWAWLSASSVRGRAGQDRLRVCFRIFRMPGTIFSHFFIAKHRFFRIFRIFRTFWDPWATKSDQQWQPEGPKNAKNAKHAKKPVFYQQKMRKIGPGLAKNVKKLRICKPGVRAWAVHDQSE